MWDVDEKREKHELNATQKSNELLSVVLKSLSTHLWVCMATGETHAGKQTASFRTFDRHKLVDFYEKD